MEKIGNTSPNISDARPIPVDDLLSALNSKFSHNFASSKSAQHLVVEVERRARLLSSVSSHLAAKAGDSQHQVALAKCLDEVFGDTICALYLSCCGLNVPARALLRRSLELGFVIVAYWDSPSDFWRWREHDGDIRFASLLECVQSDGYKTFCKRQGGGADAGVSSILNDVSRLYGELSNVVHPKPYNFSTSGAESYSFQLDELEKTISYASRANAAICAVLTYRFAELVDVLNP